MAAAVAFRDFDHRGDSLRLPADAQSENGFFADAVAHILADDAPQHLIAPVAACAPQPERGPFPQRFRLAGGNELFERLVGDRTGVEGNRAQCRLAPAMATVVALHREASEQGDALRWLHAREPVNGQPAAIQLALRRESTDAIDRMLLDSEQHKEISRRLERNSAR